MNGMKFELLGVLTYDDYRSKVIVKDDAMLTNVTIRTTMPLGHLPLALCHPTNGVVFFVFRRQYENM